MRPSTKEDLTVAQQRPVFLQDAGMQMTYDLGGSVATDQDGHVFRATDEQITQALMKAARFGVISYTSVEDWLHTHVGQAAVIQTVAQKLIDMERLSGESLEAWSDKKENVSSNLPNTIGPVGDAETACDILANLLVEHDEYEKVREENLIFRKYRKVQSDWRQFRIRSVQLEMKKQQLLLEHAREDMRQKQESHLRQLQLINQEKAHQELLDQEKHARRAVQLEAIQREHDEQEEVGRAIRQRGKIIHSDLSRLPEREEARPLQQNKAFLQAFLQRLRQTSLQQKNQVWWSADPFSPQVFRARDSCSTHILDCSKLKIGCWHRSRQRQPRERQRREHHQRPFTIGIGVTGVSGTFLPVRLGC